MDTTQISKILHALATNLKARDELIAASRVTEEQYIEKKAPTPQKKVDSIPAPPSKERLNTTIKRLILIVGVEVVLLLIGIIARILFGSDLFLVIASLGAWLFVLLLIVVGVFAKKVQNCKKEYESAMKHHAKVVEERKQNKTYNETVLPDLIKMRNVRIPGLKEEYAALMKSIREDLSKVEEYIEVQAPFLPEYYHRHAEDIANIIDRGRADSVKEAINVFEQDEQERRRLGEEMRHNQSMEAQARLAEREARKRAEWEQAQQEKALESDKRAAVERCRKCIHSTSCNYSVKSNFAQSGKICPTYRPASR